ncbi:MAG: hypothetical protein WCO56_22425 [Verrucomicrobiota bacterium]
MQLPHKQMRSDRMAVRGVSLRAFTLLEVMIAVGIFFVALISILGVMSQGLSAARSLQHSGPDCGLLASELSLTNQLPDGKGAHGDFGRMYPGFTWEWESYEASSNGLYQVDFAIFKQTGRGREPYQVLSVFMYKPDSQRSGGGFGGRSSFGNR